MKFLLSFFTNSDGNGGRVVSWKKINYQIASMAALIVPLVLVYMGKATGGELIDLYKIYIPLAIGGYVGGKAVDGWTQKNGNHP